MTLVLTVILVVVFFVMVNNKLLDSVSFGIWLAGLLANFGIYSESNIRVKKKE